MDVLSDICASLRLKAELYFHAVLHSPFALCLPHDERLIRFHCVLEGACYITLPGEEPTRLETGDLVLVPEGKTQVLSSSTDISNPVALGDVLQTYPIVDGVLSVGDTESDTRLLCGYLRFDQRNAHPVLSVLPDVVVLHASDPHCGSALGLLFSEAKLADHGASFVLHRIVEIILVQFLRNAVTVDTGKHSFSAALRDPKLAPCLQAIHADPHRNWTLDMLATHVGTSRSGLSERFNKAIGMGPISYLTQWRMIKAKELLERSDLAMAEIAEQCGYTSVPAFTRRFSACYGTSPGLWRKRLRSKIQPGTNV